MTNPIPTKVEVIEGVSYELYVTGESAKFRIYDVDAEEMFVVVKGPLPVVEARYLDCVKAAHA